MKNFYHFLNIGTHNFNFKKAYLHTKLDAKIDNFISRKDRTSLSTFIEKGYQLNEKQLYSIMGMNPPLLNQDVIDKMFDLYQADYKEQFLQILDASLHGYQQNNLHSQSIKKLYKIYKKNENIFNFIISYGQYKTFFKEDSDTFNIYKKIKKLYSLTSYLKERFRSDNYNSIEYSNEIYGKLNTIRDAYKMIQNMALSQSPGIEKYILEVEQNQDRQTLNKTVDEFSSLLSVQVKPVKVLQKFEVAQLSGEMQSLVARINKSYSDIELNMLPVEQKLEVDNMYDKRLPQLLEQYKALKPEFKKTLSENPDVLLVESLEEINTRLHKIFINHQNEMLNQLKVTHRYLKN